jgi:hypothetical protein
MKFESADGLMLEFEARAIELKKAFMQWVSTPANLTLVYRGPACDCRYVLGCMVSLL